MVLGFQIGIFIIIVLSSFFGFKIFIPTVFILAIFTMVNLYSPVVLAIQLTTIAVASCIGLFISSMVSIARIPTNIKSLQQRINNWKNEMERSSFNFLPSFIFVNVLRMVAVVIGLIIFIIAENVFLVSAENIFVQMVICGTMVFVILIGDKIEYRYDSYIKSASLTSIIVACFSIFCGFKLAELLVWIFEKILI